VRALISKYPDFYSGSPQFTDLQNAMEPSVLAAWSARDGLMDQLCADTATWGLTYWEQALGIPVEAEKSYAFRRSRVKSKLRGAGTTTVAMIQNVSESYSNGTVEITEHPEKYTIDIKFVGTVGIPPNMDDLTATLREIMPAHLHWDYIIIYNTWSSISTRTWSALAAHTWRDIKESDLK
jgi:Uncharacterized protein conserved in bacteria (DUF2313).